MRDRRDGRVTPAQRAPARRRVPPRQCEKERPREPGSLLRPLGSDVGLSSYAQWQSGGHSFECLFYISHVRAFSSIGATMTDVRLFLMPALNRLRHLSEWPGWAQTRPTALGRRWAETGIAGLRWERQQPNIRSSRCIRKKHTVGSTVLRGCYVCDAYEMHDFDFRCDPTQRVVNRCESVIGWLRLTREPKIPRIPSEAGPPSWRNSGRLLPHRVRLALAHMRGNVAEKVTLTRLAAACPMPEHTFVMLCQHVAFGRTSEAGTGPHLARLR